MRREDRVSERKRKQHEQPAWPGAGLNGAGSREAVGPCWLMRLIGAREALTHLPIDRPPIVRGSTEGAIAEVPLDGRTAADCSEVRLSANKAHECACALFGGRCLRPQNGIFMRALELERRRQSCNRFFISNEQVLQALQVRAWGQV